MHSGCGEWQSEHDQRRQRSCPRGAGIQACARSCHLAPQLVTQQLHAGPLTHMGRTRPCDSGCLPSAAISAAAEMGLAMPGAAPTAPKAPSPAIRLASHSTRPCMLRLEPRPALQTGKSCRHPSCWRSGLPSGDERRAAHQMGARQ